MPELVPHNSLTQEELAELRVAHDSLENPGLAAQLTNLIGKPIEKGFAKLPDGWQEQISKLTQTALVTATEKIVLPTLDAKTGGPTGNLFHKALAAGTGAFGGAFGFAALAVELPISTGIFLRSILDVASSEGVDLTNKEKLSETLTQCIAVLAMGSEGKNTEGVDTGYLAVRMALAQNIKMATSYLATNSGKKIVGRELAPPLIEFLAKVATRFNITLTEKAAAMAIPVVGAVGGGMLNYFFIDFYQKLAKAHFFILRMEAKYGQEEVRRLYETMKKSEE